MSIRNSYAAGRRMRTALGMDGKGPWMTRPQAPETKHYSRDDYPITRLGSFKEAIEHLRELELSEDGIEEVRIMEPGFLRFYETTKPLGDATFQTGFALIYRQGTAYWLSTLAHDATQNDIEFAGLCIKEMARECSAQK